MNKGISLSSGDILCFFNSDDYFQNDNILSLISKIASECEANTMISCGIEFIDSSSGIKVDFNSYPSHDKNHF